jgi:hypothetical protein
VGPLLFLLYAATGPAAPTAHPPVVLDVDPAVIAAARGLGPGVAFFTSKAHPLTAFGQLHDPAAQVGTGDVAGAKEVQALLRAAGVKVGGGAVDLMRLYSVHHLTSLFRRHPQLRLFIVRTREDGREQELADQGGGVRLVLRGRGQTVGATEAKAAPPPTPAPFVTSFGPLLGAELSATGRSRQFDAQEGARKETRQARPGHSFVVLHLERDFSTGVGLVSFLFGSGIVVKPEFEQLSLLDAAHHSYTLSLTDAEGRAVDLAFEVPAKAQGLVLADGDARVPLGPLLGAKGSAPN